MSQPILEKIGDRLMKEGCVCSTSVAGVDGHLNHALPYSLCLLDAIAPAKFFIY